MLNSAEGCSLKKFQMPCFGGSLEMKCRDWRSSYPILLILCKYRKLSQCDSTDLGPSIHPLHPGDNETTRVSSEFGRKGRAHIEQTLPHSQ